MKNLSGAILVAIGAVFGCGAAVTIPQSIAQSSSNSGGWLCANAGEFDDNDRGIPNAQEFTNGMNRMAPNSPKGQIVVIPLGGNIASSVCVKQ